MAVTTQAQVTTNSPTKADHETVRRRREGETAGVAAAAFESLLDSTRTLVRAETNLAQRVSPSQMFEAPLAKGSDRRTAALDEHQRSDRTEARRDADKTATDVAGRRSANSPPQYGQTMAAKSNHPNVSQSTAAEAAAAGWNVPPSGAKFSSPPQSLNGAGVETANHSPTERERPVLKTIEASPPAMLSSITVSGATSVDRSVAAAPNVAQQVGELLSANRGGVELQGASSNTTVGDGRSNAASPKTAPAADRTPQSQGLARPSEESTTKEASPFERLVRSMRLQPGLRNSSARLQLHPPELGRLRVDVRMAGDQVEIEVRTESDAARELVSRRAEELKTALEQHGIQVNRFVVTVHSAPEQPAWTGSHDGSAVPSGMQRNPSWTSGRRRSGEERTDDGGANAAMSAASTTAAVAEARLDIRI